MSRAGLGPSIAASAANVMDSPKPNSASWPVWIGRRSAADRAGAREDVAEGVEVGAPGQSDLRAGRDGGVHQGDRGVRGARARVAVKFAGDDPEQRAAVL